MADSTVSQFWQVFDLDGNMTFMVGPKSHEEAIDYAIARKDFREKDRKDLKAVSFPNRELWQKHRDEVDEDAENQRLETLAMLDKMSDSL